MFRHDCPRYSFFPVNQVEQWKQINPDDVDKMPIQTGIFQRSMVLRRVPAPPRVVQQIAENPHSNEHMQRVHTRHGKVQREEYLGVPLIDGLIGMARNSSFEIE